MIAFGKAGMPDNWIVFATIAEVSGLFIRDRLPVLNRSLSGFGDPATIFVTNAALVLFGRRLLPEYESKILPPDLSLHAQADRVRLVPFVRAF